MTGPSPEVWEGTQQVQCAGDDASSPTESWNSEIQTAKNYFQQQMAAASESTRLCSHIKISTENGQYQHVLVLREVSDGEVSCTAYHCDAQGLKTCEPWQDFRATCAGDVFIVAVALAESADFVWEAARNWSQPVDSESFAEQCFGPELYQDQVLRYQEPLTISFSDTPDQAAALEALSLGAKTLFGSMTALAHVQVAASHAAAFAAEAQALAAAAHVTASTAAANAVAMTAHAQALAAACAAGGSGLAAATAAAQAQVALAEAAALSTGLLATSATQQAASAAASAASAASLRTMVTVAVPAFAAPLLGVALVRFVKSLYHNFSCRKSNAKGLPIGVFNFSEQPVKISIRPWDADETMYRLKAKAWSNFVGLGKIRSFLRPSSFGELRPVLSDEEVTEYRLKIKSKEGALLQELKVRRGEVVKFSNVLTLSLHDPSAIVDNGEPI